MLNNNGKFGVRAVYETPEEAMAAFDTLPLCLRRIINNAPFMVSATSIANGSWNEDTLNRAIESAIPKNAAACYGPDHPQAKEVQ